MTAAYQCSEFAVGADVALVEGTAGDRGEPHRESEEVWSGVVVAYWFARLANSLRDPTLLRLSVGATRQDRFCAISSSMNLAGDAMGGQHSGEVRRKPCQEGRGGREGDEHGQEGRVAHHERDLAWPPRQRSGAHGGVHASGRRAC